MIGEATVKIQWKSVVAAAGVAALAMGSQACGGEAMPDPATAACGACGGGCGACGGEEAGCGGEEAGCGGGCGACGGEEAGCGGCGCGGCGCGGCGG